MTHVDEAPVILPAFYRGPASTANGGYAAGVAAALVGNPARAQLRRPPPLDRPLEIRRHGDAVELLDGADTVVRAEPAVVDVAVPDVDLGAVRVATADPVGLAAHTAPTCVVCGPDRADGFRIFPGRVAEGVVGCQWTAPSDPRDGPALRPEIAWAALDCPGGWALLDRSSTRDFFPALVSLAVDLRRPPLPRETLLVLGWVVGVEGRKHHAASALLGLDGEVRATAEQVCVEMAPTWAQ